MNHKYGFQKAWVQILRMRKGIALTKTAREPDISTSQLSPEHRQCREIDLLGEDSIPKSVCCQVVQEAFGELGPQVYQAGTVLPCQAGLGLSCIAPCDIWKSLVSSPFLAIPLLLGREGMLVFCVRFVFHCRAAVWPTVACSKCSEVAVPECFKDIFEDVIVARARPS